jgi:uncharacterized delta-60 repeat protein
MRGLTHRITALVATGLLATSLTAVATTPAAAAAGDTDTGFSSNIGTGFNSTVRSVAVQSDDKIIVGGDFTSINGTTSNYIARLNADGTPDTTFSTNIGSGFNGKVDSVAVQSDDKIIVGGIFTSINGTTSNYIARLNADGTPDTTFSTNIGSGFNSWVYSVAVQSDDKIIVGGIFNNIDGTTSNRIARLDADGTPDAAFSTNTGSGFNTTVRSVAVQSDDKIIVGGYFTSINGTTSNYIARLDADGAPDTTFSANIGSGFNSPVYSVAVQSDDKIIVGGFFDDIDGTTSSYIARLDADGTPDTTFSANIGSGFNRWVYSVAVQSDDKIIVGGIFSRINGTTSSGIARLNADGTPDTTFSTNTGSGLNNTVYSVAVQSDDKIIVGGFFTRMDGTTSNRIARLNAAAAPTPTPTPTPTPATPTVTPAPTIAPTPDMRTPAAPRIVKKALAKLKRQLAKGKAGAKSLRLKLQLSGDADARASALQWRFKVKASKSQRAKKTWSGWTSIAVSPDANTATVQVGKDRKVRKSLTGPARDNATVKLQVRAANDAGSSKAKSVRLRPRAAVPVLPANG